MVDQAKKPMLRSYSYCKAIVRESYFTERLSPCLPFSLCELRRGLSEIFTHVASMAWTQIPLIWPIPCRGCAFPPPSAPFLLSDDFISNFLPVEQSKGAP